MASKFTGEGNVERDVFRREIDERFRDDDQTPVVVELVVADVVRVPGGLSVKFTDGREVFLSNERVERARSLP